MISKREKPSFSEGNLPTIFRARTLARSKATGPKIMADDDNAEIDAHVEALEKAGQPVIGIDLTDRLDIAGEFFRWEFATAVAGAVMGINPFDQPNVQESKSITGQE